MRRLRRYEGQRGGGQHFGPRHRVRLHHRSPENDLILRPNHFLHSLVFRGQIRHPRSQFPFVANPEHVLKQEPRFRLVKPVQRGDAACQHHPALLDKASDERRLFGRQFEHIGQDDGTIVLKLLQRRVRYKPIGNVGLAQNPRCSQDAAEMRNLTHRFELADPHPVLIRVVHRFLVVVDRDVSEQPASEERLVGGPFLVDYA